MQLPPPQGNHQLVTQVWAGQSFMWLYWCVYYSYKKGTDDRLNEKHRTALRISLWGTSAIVWDRRGKPWQQGDVGSDWRHFRIKPKTECKLWRLSRPNVRASAIWAYYLTSYDSPLRVHHWDKPYCLSRVTHSGRNGALTLRKLGSNPANHTGLSAEEALIEPGWMEWNVNTLFKKTKKQQHIKNKQINKDIIGVIIADFDLKEFEMFNHFNYLSNKFVFSWKSGLLSK